MNSTSLRHCEASRSTFARGSFPWVLPLLAIVLALVAPRAAAASTYRWHAAVSGNWNEAANWTLVSGPAGVGYPNGSGDTAQLSPPTAPSFTVTIPDGVTVTVERISFQSANVTIAGTGSALLVMETAGAEAQITSMNATFQTFDVPIQLKSNLRVSTMTLMIFSNRISDDGTPRSVTLASTLNYNGVFHYNGNVSNTYTGATTLQRGYLELGRTNGAIAIAGPLVIDPTGRFGTEVRLLSAENVADNAPVRVADGGFLAGSGGFNVKNQTEAVGDLTVVDRGTVSLGDAGTGHLTMNSLTMESGHLWTGTAGSQFVLNGNVTALNGSISGAGSLALNGAAQVFSVSAPVQQGGATGLFIDVRVTGAGGIVKEGPGELFLMKDNDYTGDTVILDGHLVVQRNNPATSVTLRNGVLRGSGAVGAVTATGGAIWPGFGLNTGTIALSPGVIIKGDFRAIQLAVTGTVSIGGAVLDALVTNGPLPPPALAAFTIIDNDGSDPVNGTFADLQEGAALTVGAFRLQITYRGGDGNDVVLHNVTPIQYSLAEGATGTFFDEDILIVNPNTVDAPVTLTFLLPGGGTIVDQRVVPAQSRVTVKVDELSGLEATTASVLVVSDLGRPLAVERTMFWDQTHYGGHTANAVPQPGLRWLFAEGAQGFFNTFLQIANPNAGDVDATVTFLREHEPPVTDAITLPGRSRTTVPANAYAELADRSFGIVIDAPQAITAERAMYFATTPERFWSGGHANVGSIQPATSWFHPEGASGTFFTTFIMMINPQQAEAKVRLRFLLPDGRIIEIPKTIQPLQRLTVNPAAEGIADLQNASFSTVVESSVAIVSERAMYWPGDDTVFGEGHVSSGLTSTALDWALAEGRVGGPSAYTTYILLANPQSTAVDVTVTFLRESGEPIVKKYTVDSTSRFNIDVGGMVPELQNESFGARIEVTNNVPIAVERSMYWNAEGRFWAGGSNALATIMPRP